MQKGRKGITGGRTLKAISEDRDLVFFAENWQALLIISGIFTQNKL